MLIRMDVVPKKGQKHQIAAEPQDLIAFEREFNKSVAKFQDNIFLTDLFWLAWHVDSRTGKTSDSFDVWIADIESIGVAEEQDIVPLETEASIG
jgi:hypothetical protein